MADRSIFEIDIDDQKFRRFSTLFEQYADSLKKSVGDWQKVNERINAANAAMAKTTSSGGGGGGGQVPFGDDRQSRKINQSRNDLDRITLNFLQWERLMKPGGPLFAMLGNLPGGPPGLRLLGEIAKYGPALGPLAALAGLAGGAMAAAPGVAAERRFALGVGTTVAGARGFQAAFANMIGDPQAFMRTLGKAQSGYGPEYSAMVRLFGAQGADRALAGKDQTRMGFAVVDQLLGQIKSLTKQYPGLKPENAFQSLGGPALGFQWEDIRALLKTLSEDPEKFKKERQAALEAADAAAKNAEITGKAADRLVALNQAMDKFSTVAGNLATIVEAMAAPKIISALESLSKFVDSVSKVASGTVLESRTPEEWDAAKKMVEERQKSIQQHGPPSIFDPFGTKRVKPFAKGGIVTQPTNALLGEAGPEAVIPLGRGPSGGRFNVPAGSPMSGERTTITLSNGEKVTVNKNSAAQFQGFFNDLIAAGAPVHDLGGYGLRPGNASQHPVGMAIDWNQSSRNVVGRDVGQWISKNQTTLSQLESKWGISGGEHWRNPDTGHFSIDALMGGGAVPTAGGGVLSASGAGGGGFGGGGFGGGFGLPGGLLGMFGGRLGRFGGLANLVFGFLGGGLFGGGFGGGGRGFPGIPGGPRGIPGRRTGPTGPRLPSSTTTTTGGPGGPMMTGTLADIRAKQAEELKDPAVRERLLAMTKGEVGGQGPAAQQAFMESVLNRAAARGHSVLQTLNDPTYYPGTTFASAARGISEAQRKGYDPLLASVLGGSNISNFATGNASGNVRFGGGPTTFSSGGELFGIEGNKKDQRWVKMVRAGSSPAAATAITQGVPVPNDVLDTSLSQLGEKYAGPVRTGDPATRAGRYGYTTWNSKTGRPEVYTNPDLLMTGSKEYKQTFSHEYGHAGVKALMGTPELSELQKNLGISAFPSNIPGMKGADAWEELRQREADIDWAQKRIKEHPDSPSYKRMLSDAQVFEKMLSREISDPTDRTDEEIVKKARQYNEGVNQIAAQRLKEQAVQNAAGGRRDGSHVPDARRKHEDRGETGHGPLSLNNWQAPDRKQVRMRLDNNIGSDVSVAMATMA